MSKIKTLGILADRPTASTGMAVVCHNIAKQLCEMPRLRVVYFGRWGLPQFSGIDVEGAELYEGYELVNCEGGVWQENTVQKIIEAYSLDVLFSEDDWFSAGGLVNATNKCEIPFHFLTPIDSLPIHRDAFKIFKKCTKVYTPNQSYKQIKNGIFLPHGVDSEMFTPLRKKQKKVFKKFTFLWIGRDEPRKALGRAILAFKKIHKQIPDVQMVVRTDWKPQRAQKTIMYLANHPELPIIRDVMRDIPHKEMQRVYANCDVLVITSKAGGFEMGSTEMMACGSPVLCTDWTFMNEQIVDGKNGFKIPVADMCGDEPNYGRIWGNISIDRLAEKMVWCAKNPERVKLMGNWARKYVEKTYSWKEVAKRLYNSMGVK